MAKVSNWAIQFSIGFWPRPQLQPAETTPSVFAVTPSADACDVVSTDPEAPESSIARTGRPLISTASMIRGLAGSMASSSALPAPPVTQYASEAP